MFKSILISLALAPILLGVIAAKGRDGRRGLNVLKIGWVAYSVLWICAVYGLKYL